MFTLCMSRGHTSDLRHAKQQNCAENKQVKGGYLLRYKRGLFCNTWREEWFVLFEDSTLAWFTDKGQSHPRGSLRIGECPELLACGEWTRLVPKKPRFPFTCHLGQLLAIGSRKSDSVHWLMAQSPAEVNDWMTAISNTLPPPPHMPLANERLSIRNGHTPYNKNNGIPATTAHAEIGSEIGNTATPYESTSTALVESDSGFRKKANYNDADHTVISGVVIDWGHGWGWGQSAWFQPSYIAEAAVNSAIYCHALGDSSVSAFDDADCGVFGDFFF